MTTRPARLLAIDDSLTIRRLLETVLTGAGYAVDFAATGQEGVDRARSAPPDLILLDYVLPDMKGVDVAAALARAENTRAVPVVVMSAKNDDLRPLFRPFASVVGFMAKPFTPGEVCFLVAELVARAQGGEAEPADAAQVAFTRPQLEAGARALYGFLRERFARIPEWAAGLADASPAPYFAKRILTPDLMERLLRGLAPVLRDALGAGAVASDGATLQGHTSVLPLSRLLRELSDSGRTGRLTLEYGARKTSLYLRRGELVLATHDQPDDYVRGHESALAGIEPGPLEAARAEQKKTGKPLFASLAEAEVFAPARTAELLRTLGKRALLEALEAGPVPFRWHDRALLAPYVEAHASAYSFEQLRLERLRQVDDWAQVELQVSSLATVFHRVPGFSRKLGEFELDENERRVLTLVDSRRTVQQLVEKTSLPTFEVFHVLFRAAQVGLIRRAQAASGVETEPGTGSRPVAILDSDVEGVEQPLARALQKRRHPLPLVSLQGSPDLLASLVEKAPRLAILNVDTPGFDERRVVTQVRATLGVSDMALVAVMEEESDRASDLLAMGYDAVLVKPFPLSEVERFLAA